jgi:hypothetical protein
MPLIAPQSNHEIPFTWLHYAAPIDARIPAKLGNSRLCAISSRKFGGELPASALRCWRSVPESRNARATANSVRGDTFSTRPCSSIVYQLRPIFASAATSSRRKPRTRRRPNAASWGSAGRSTSRRPRRKRPSSTLRDLTQPACLVRTLRSIRFNLRGGDSNGSFQYAAGACLRRA